jgi:hypothetical protein
MTDRIPLDDMTSDALDQLYADLDRYEEVLATLNETLVNRSKQTARAEADLAALRQVARDYCPACGRGDAAPTVADWEQQKTRADHAEATLDRVRALRDDLRGITGARYIADALDTILDGEQPHATPGPCPACRRADQAGLAPTEQHRDCAKEQH